MKEFLYFTLILLLFTNTFVPAYAVETDSSAGTHIESDSPAGTGVVEKSANAHPISIQIQNPLAADSITEFLTTIINIVLILATPIIVLFIIIAGFMYVTARGNETKVSQAHRALLFALIGGLLILGAFVILEIIKGTVAAFMA